MRKELGLVLLNQPQGLPSPEGKEGGWMSAVDISRVRPTRCIKYLRLARTWGTPVKQKLFTVESFSEGWGLLRHMLARKRTRS